MHADALKYILGKIFANSKNLKTLNICVFLVHVLCFCCCKTLHAIFMPCIATRLIKTWYFWLNNCKLHIMSNIFSVNCVFGVMCVFCVIFVYTIYGKTVFWHCSVIWNSSLSQSSLCQEQGGVKNVSKSETHFDITILSQLFLCQPDTFSTTAQIMVLDNGHL